MGLAQSETIAIIISITSLIIMIILILIIFNKIKIEIEQNSLKNSTYSLLEHSYWRNQREIKNLQTQLKEAMDDSINAHDAMNKMSKAIKDGTSGNS